MQHKSAVDPHASASYLNVGDQLPEPLQMSDSSAQPTDARTPYRKNESVYARWPAMVLHTAWLVLVSIYVSNLLVFAILGNISGALHWNSSVASILNSFVATLLAFLWSFATERLAIPLGQTMGWLWNASFGIPVEVIVSCCISESTLDVANHGVGQYSLRSQER